MQKLKRRWTVADSAFLLAGIVYAAFLYLRLHYTGIYKGHFGELTWDWLILGYYMAEAALVGSFADWFAVTAVFRTPWICKILPWLVQHTAILPKSKEAFVRGCAEMVEREFLTRKTLLMQKKQVQAVDELISYLAKNENKLRVQAFLLDFAEGVLRKVDTDKLSRQFEAKIKDSLADVNAHTYLQNLFKALIAQRKDEAFYNWLLEQLVLLAESNAIRLRIHQELEKRIAAQKEESFWARIKLWAAQTFDIVNVDDATDAAVNALIATTRRLREDSEWHKWFIGQMQRLVTSLYAADEWQRVVHLLQNRAVQDLSLRDALKQLLDNMINVLCRSTEKFAKSKTVAQTTILAQAIAQAVDVLERDLRDNEELKIKLEQYLQHFFGLGLLKAQSMLGRIVEKILNAMEEARLVNIVQSKVDADMQRIRLNGTVMGALIGAVLYLVKCAW